MPVVRMKNQEIEFPDSMAQSVIESALLKFNQVFGIGGPTIDPRERTIAEAQPLSMETFIAPLTKAKQLRDETAFFRRQNPELGIDPSGIGGAVVRGVGKEVVRDVFPGAELIVTHNIAPGALQFADRLGGLPVPSLGITKTGLPIEDFGDITLIGPKNLATPGIDNPIFPTDAFSVRFPPVRTVFSEQEKSKILDLFPDVGVTRSKSDFFKDVQRFGIRQQLFQNPLIQSKFLKSKGILTKQDIQETGSSGLGESAEKKLVANEKDYRKFISELPEKLGIKGKEEILLDPEKVPEAKGQFSLPLSLENLVVAMKGEAEAGTEALPNPGVLSMKARLSSPFRSIKELQDARDEIVDQEFFEVEVGEIKFEFDEVVEEIANKAPLQLTAIIDGIVGLGIRGPNQTKDWLEGFLNIEVSDSLFNKVNGLIDRALDAPVPYFEAKPKRAVKLEEFKGALIPRETSQQTRNVLKKRGISKVFEFDSPEEKATLLRKFPELMFGAGGLALGTEAFQTDSRRTQRDRRAN